MMVGILLAAGASKRMGSPKPLVRKGSESFIAHGIRHLWAGCGSVVTVLGANAHRVRHDAEHEFEQLVTSGALHADLVGAHRQGAKGLEVCFIVNRRWRSGMLSSVQAGVREAMRMKPEAVLILPVDHPAVSPATVRDLAAVIRLALQACRTPHERARFRYALVPRHRCRRGHPVALSPALAAAIAEDRAAVDLSDAIRRNARLVGYLDVRDAGILENVNTPRSGK